MTGGLGFIGSAVVRHLINHTDHDVCNVYVGTYAATTGSVAEVADSDRYRHEDVDITDRDQLQQVFNGFEPDDRRSVRLPRYGQKQVRREHPL